MSGSFFPLRIAGWHMHESINVGTTAVIMTTVRNAIYAELCVVYLVHISRVSMRVINKLEA